MSKVLVIGESCKDRYVYGTSNRVSPEDPLVPVLKVERIEEREGMSQNVVNNLLSLGMDAWLLDNSGEIIKERVYLNDKQIVRIDYDSPATNLSQEELLANLYIQEKDADCILIQDYGKGLLTEELIQTAIETNKPVFVDAYGTTPLHWYKGAYLIKPNYIEAQMLTGKRIVSEMMASIHETTHCNNVVITSGEEGLYYSELIEDGTFFTSNMESLAKKVVDVAGAGDTVIAALVYYFMTKNKNNIQEACEFASKAAAICLLHEGVYAPNLKEIENG